MDSVRDAGGRFVKGSPRPKNSGRARGVGNLVPARIFADVLEQLEARKFSVIDEAVKLYRSRKTNVEMKVRLLTVLASVSFPKKLAVASVKRVTHDLDVRAIMADPALAKQMESLSMALEGRLHEAKLLPAPGESREVQDIEFEDLPPKQS